MRHVIKELTNIRINDNAYFLLIAGIPYRLERLVRVAFFPEAVRKIVKIDFVNGAKKHRNRPLQNLVFKCRMPIGR